MILKDLYERDGLEVRIGQFSLPIKTGDQLSKGSPDNPRSPSASRSLIQSVLALTRGYIKELGYEAGDENKKGGKNLVVQWAHPEASEGLVYGRLNTETLKFEYTHEKYRLETLGLLGFGLAYDLAHPTFRDAWLIFIRDFVARGSSAITADATGEISDIIYGVLRYGLVWSQKHDRQKKFGNGVKVPTKELESLEVQPNFRDILADDIQFEQTMMTRDPKIETGPGRARFIGPQLTVLERKIAYLKHTVLIGPPGVGKSICAFEALKRAGHSTPEVDFFLIVGHEEYKTYDAIGQWQPTDQQGVYKWIDGPLTRALGGSKGNEIMDDAGKRTGKPLLVEELTRMPTRSQNVFIPALSDGYIVLNEKDGEVVQSGLGFVMIADMNADPMVDEIDLYGAAFGSRVRKIEYGYPDRQNLLLILKQESGCSVAVAQAISTVVDYIMKKYEAHEVIHPISPRAAVYWAEDIAEELEVHSERRLAAMSAANTTWVRDVCGSDEKLRQTVLNEVEAAFRKVDVRS